MTPAEEIEFFFTPPDIEQQGGRRSTLHLLRREVQDCLIGDVTNEAHAIDVGLRSPRRLFASVMVIMAGIDLLAKFHAGSDEDRQVGNRIRAFAKRFIFSGRASADRFAEVLYFGLRNPLLHSFTLHHETLVVSLVSGGYPSSFFIASNPSNKEQFVIGIEGLYRAFVEALRAYHAVVAANADAQSKFAAMFPTYGSIEMWSAVLAPVAPAASPAASTTRNIP